MSVAVSRTSIVPASASPGVPAKVRAAVSKVSQAGSGAPLARAASKSSVSPASTSAKASGGRAKAKGTPRVAAWSAIGVPGTGASLVGTTCTVTVAATLEPAASSTTKAIVRVASDGLWESWPNVTVRSASR